MANAARFGFIKNKKDINFNENNPDEIKNYIEGYWKKQWDSGTKYIPYNNPQLAEDKHNGEKAINILKSFEIEGSSPR